MSRSRKKNPSYSDYNPNYTPWAKRQASKRVRRYLKTLTNGSLYKKVFPTWDIFDYKGLWIRRSYGWEQKQEIPDKAYRK